VDLLDAQAVRASLGDGAAFAAVFDRHHRVIWAYLARSAGREAANDLAGEVFLVAFRRRDSFDESRGTVRAWLYGIATNQLREHARRSARGRRALLRLAGRRESAGVVDGIDGLDGIGEIDQRGPSEASVVVACLRRLSDRDREVLVLYAWERLSYDEIAVALGVAVGTVRSRLARARARLRAAMELGDPPGQEPGEQPPAGDATNPVRRAR
jgi:RNA polymerase sigma-70 factor (ECF subfamily)